MTRTDAQLGELTYHPDTGWWEGRVTLDSGASYALYVHTSGGTDTSIFRLAWDTCMSAFGSRQALYERFFFGDPVRMAGALVQSHDRSKYMDRVHAFLEQSKNEVEVG